MALRGRARIPPLAAKAAILHRGSGAANRPATHAGAALATPFPHAEIKPGNRTRVETSGGIQASLPGRYAMALFELARDEKALDAVSTSLASLRAALAESDDLRRLVGSPLVSREQATAAVEGLATAMRLDPITAKFLGVLAGNRRLSQLEAVIYNFNMLAARHRGETTAEVVSAHALAPDQVDALKARLKAQTGRDVAIEARVDPAILGGLIVKLGSRQIDGSIRTKLNTLAHAMKG